MRSRGFEVNGDSLGTNPVVKADELEPGGGGIIKPEYGEEVSQEGWRGSRPDPLKIKQTGV